MRKQHAYSFILFKKRDLSKWCLFCQIIISHFCELKTNFALLFCCACTLVKLSNGKSDFVVHTTVGSVSPHSDDAGSQRRELQRTVPTSNGLTALPRVFPCHLLLLTASQMNEALRRRPASRREFILRFSQHQVTNAHILFCEADLPHLISTSAAIPRTYQVSQLHEDSTVDAQLFWQRKNVLIYPVDHNM